MKIGATILLFVLLAESFFYYSYFSISLLKIKMVACEKMVGLQEDYANEPSLIKEPVNNLDKDEGEEAWYRNELYDVIKREAIKGISYVYLLRDEAENELLTENYNFFNTGSINGFHGVIVKTNSFKCSHAGLDLQYLFPVPRKSFPNKVLPLNPTAIHIDFIGNHRKKVPAPPPKFSPVISYYQLI